MNPSTTQGLGASIGKNAVFGAFSQGVYIASRFVTVPFVIAHLGLSGYGIWAIILTLAGYMRFGTAGIKSAFLQYICRSPGSGEFPKACKVLSNRRIAFLVASVLGPA